MTLTATCATMALVLMSAKGGETINLKGTCGPIAVSKAYPRQVTINAGGATVRGLVVTGANVRWRSGRVEAPLGFNGKAGDGYGLLIRGARNVRVEGVTFGASRKAVVVDQAEAVALLDNRFDGYGEDGIIASQVVGLTITRNRFVNVRGNPTTCTTAGGVVPGLSSRDCVARGGAWVDGWHPDAVQLRNGVKRAVVTFNYVAGRTQGLTQMDTTGDAPLEDVLVADNEVRATAHHITLGGTGCINCRIERNTVRRFDATSFKAVVRAGPARRCGNDVQDEKPDGGC